MKLIINSETRNKCGHGSSEYWFSYRDYTIKNISELSVADKPEDMGQTTYFVSIGLIPFVTVSNEEIMRAAIEERGSAKLKSIFAKVDSEHFVETFWKYYNVYPELTENTDEFINNYLNKKIVEWCEENKIDYSVE